VRFQLLLEDGSFVELSYM